jgi:hypothetical protein
MQRKPTLFIIGAPKAGTTALHAYFEKHPQVNMSTIKEPNYFSWSEIEAQQLYYKKENIKTESEYLSLFHPSNSTKHCGEGSVSYLFYPEVPRRIFEYQPNARIIISLRNPVSRAFSHYLMDYSLGLIKIDFETIFRNGIDHSITKNYFQQYFSISDYAPQIQRYLNVFKKEQIHFLLHETLITHPHESLKQISKFLEIDYQKETESIDQQNVTLGGKNALISALYKNETIRKFTSRILNDQIKNKIKGLFLTKKTLPKLPDSFSEELKEYYAASVIQTEMLSGLNLQAWK